MVCMKIKHVCVDHGKKPSDLCPPEKCDSNAMVRDGWSDVMVEWRRIIASKKGGSDQGPLRTNRKGGPVSGLSSVNSGKLGATGCVCAHKAFCRLLIP